MVTSWPALIARVAIGRLLLDDRLGIHGGDLGPWVMRAGSVLVENRQRG